MQSRSTSVAFYLLWILASSTGLGQSLPNIPSALILDVYCPNATTGDPTEAKAISLFAQALKEGKTPKQYPSLWHEQFPTDTPVNINQEITSDSNVPAIIIHARITAAVKNSKDLKIHFSQLGLSPAYSGTTELVIHPAEHRVLMLPAVDSGNGSTFYLIVSLYYKPSQTDDGTKSRFEVRERFSGTARKIG